MLIEPLLHPLTGEHLSHQSSNREDNARVDIAASNVLSPFDRTFFDVGVYNPFSTTTYYKHLASNLSDHLTKPYSHILNYIHCRLSFSPLRSAILFLQGAVA